MIAAALSDLAILAETLNEESNELNGIIETFNRKLRDHNLGVEVWCRESDDLAFGFCRTGDPSEWQLAARVTTARVSDDKKEFSSSIPLLKRSRNERIRALELMPAIISSLKEDAELKVAAIRNAKRLAESLQ